MAKLMNRAAHFSAIILLIFNGITACAGGLFLAIDPSGNKMSLPLKLLQHSPFSNFFIPGLILFSANGLMSFLIVALAIKKVKNYGLLICIQGCILTGWLTAQLLLGIEASILHIIYGIIAITLVTCGALLQSKALV
jgi:hypothetical protein